MSRRYTSSPLCASMACSGTPLLFFTVEFQRALLVHSENHTKLICRAHSVGKIQNHWILKVGGTYSYRCALGVKQ
jgi:hypothetical protein